MTTLTDENPDILNDLNVVAQEVLITPEAIKKQSPLARESVIRVGKHRKTVENILARRDPRLIVVVGPCSIHNTGAAMEYAWRLHRLAEQCQNSLFLMMRVYFEKPRTTTGWKGLINDPYLNDTFHIEDGLLLARRLLVQLAELDLPAATEALDPIVPQYISDLIAWSAIGARTAESQTHREMASGLSMPIGFKNTTDGDLDTAINALLAARKPHSFLGINQQGRTAVIRTRGNQFAHIVMRGGAKPNYDSVSIALCENRLREAQIPANIMVDCSHANCNKDASLQPLVAENIINQIAEGNRSIIGIMLESNLKWGRQNIPDDLSQLEYGVSITDPCIDWETTEDLLLHLAERYEKVLPTR